MLLTAAVCFGQTAANGVLASSAGRNFTAEDLSPEARHAYEDRKVHEAEFRGTLQRRYVAQLALDAETKAANKTEDELVKAATAKLTDPTDAEVRAFYDENKDKLGGRSYESVAVDLKEYMKDEARHRAVNAMFDSLAAKHKVAAVGDISKTEPSPKDVVIKAGTRSITYAEFLDHFKLQIYDNQMNTLDLVRSDLEDLTYVAALEAEAKERKTDVQTVIAQEVTNKLRKYTDLERYELDSALRDRLAKKYNTKIFLTEPPPIVQNNSVDDDPAEGPADAKVTIVMFSDFQCPACSATHPVLKKVIAEYPGKIRFVVRDFPLESIHDHAFAAARAANAAAKQGKFFEYIDLLYDGQKNFSDDAFVRFAKGLGLDLKKFEIDFNDKAAADEIRKDVADGNAYGVSGTPTIFINGKKVRNPAPDILRKTIDAELAAK
jgi:protein-disulfide isomerase